MGLFKKLKEADKAIVEDLLEKRKERVLDKINTVDLDKLNKRERKAVSEALLKLEAGHELSNSEISKIDKIFTKRDVYTEKKPAADAAAKPYEESTEAIKAEMDATAEVTNDRKPISEITNTDLLTKEEKELLAKLDSDKPLTETDKEGIYRIIAREPMLSDKTSFFGFTTRGEVTSNSAEDFARGYAEKEEDRIAENTATVKKWMDVQTRINTEAVNPEETTEEERTAGENFFKIMGGDKRSETQQLAVDIFNALQDKLIADTTPVKTEEVKEVENLAGGGSVESYKPEEEKPESETPAPKETEEQKKEAEKEKEGDPAAAAGGPEKTN